MNMSFSHVEGQFGQPHLVDQMLNSMRNGFFVEAGAADGQKLSNTLFFELKRNWTGLLVEPNPVLYGRLVNKRR